LIKELGGQIIKTKKDRGYFIIGGLLNSEDEIELAKRKSEKINIKADEVKLSRR
jgi:hypothetical protein